MSDPTQEQLVAQLQFHLQILQQQQALQRRMHPFSQSPSQQITQHGEQIQMGQPGVKQIDSSIPIGEDDAVVSAVSSRPTSMMPMDSSRNDKSAGTIPSTAHVPSVSEFAQTTQQQREGEWAGRGAAAMYHKQEQTNMSVKQEDH